MRSCEDFALLASLAVDGEADQAEQEELAAHLAECSACRAYYEDIRNIHESFAGPEAAPPADFAAGVMERVRETPQEQPVKVVPPPRWRRWIPGAALAACCALVVLGVWRGGATKFASRSMVAADNAAPALEGQEEAEFAKQAEEAPVPDMAAPQRDAKATPASDVPPALDDALVDGAAGESAPADVPAPAMLAPQALESAAVEGRSQAFGETVLLTAGASPAASAWVEETLGCAWEPGEVWRLTEEQYADLRGVLEAAGEDFTEEVIGRSQGVWLLAAK